MKTETKEIFVLTKAIGEKETVALKLEQSAKEVAQRPPPWRDKFRACQSGAKSAEQSHNRGGSMLWLASSYLEHEATIQEAVKKYHLCLSIPINCLFVGGSKRKGPFARQVLGCERHASLGRRRLHDPQFDDHSEQQDREVDEFGSTLSSARLCFRLHTQTLTCPRIPSMVWKQLCVVVAVST